MEGVILVDLRDKEMFDFESVDGSINIPFENLLDRKHLKKIRKEEIWLISSSEIRSHDAAFLLNQLGYDARAVNTNIENILGLKDNPVPAKGYGSDEKEKFNYRNFIKQVDQPNTDVIQETDEVVIRQGGC